MVDKTPDEGAKKPAEEGKKLELVMTTKQTPQEPVIDDHVEQEVDEETKEEQKRI